MKIELTKKQWEQVKEVMDAKDDCSATYQKQKDQIVGTIDIADAPKATMHQRGGSIISAWVDSVSLCIPVEIELSADEVKKIIHCIDESIEAKREQLDDDVTEFDATDTNEPIDEIREYLESALELAKAVKNLETIRDIIEKQQDEADKIENEKDAKIAELDSIIDTKNSIIARLGLERDVLLGRQRRDDATIDQLRTENERLRKLPFRDDTDPYRRRPMY